jgi:uncharacterized membrane protein
VKRSERAAIARAIAQAEDGTSGRIAVRIVLHRHDRANAALILVAPKARSFAVIGDRALHDRVGDEFWSELVRAGQPYFARGEVPEGVIHVVVRLGEAFKAHFACD